jgi:predicted dehydrogenase
VNAASSRIASPSRTPRIGFLGVGWIGRERMRALTRAELAEAVVIADPDPASRQGAASDAPAAQVEESLDALLTADLDGVVIATPSALHAEQAIACLERGIPVFCQKPLARNSDEAAAVVDRARAMDLLLGVDLGYRHLRAALAAREAVTRGDIGRPYAADLAFHNAYGPDKAWFQSRRLAGGGCLMDLGIHLVDLVMWLTGAGGAAIHSAQLFRAGRPVSAQDDGDGVEDLALATFTTDRGIIARLACSWHLPVGRDCAFECTLYGTAGAVSIRNVGGSFYDFAASRHRGTQSESLVEPPDAWPPRAICAWATGLSAGAGFDPETERLVALGRVLDDIYLAAA